MDNIKITGSDKECEITGEDFGYVFLNGHPVSATVSGEKLPDIPYPEISGKKTKSKTKLVHKYWDSALVITEYRHGLKTLEVRYHIMSSGEMKIETVFSSKG